MNRIMSKFISVFLSAVIMVFSVAALPSAHNIITEISAKAALSPDDPDITIDKLRSEMVIKYQAFIDKYTGSGFDIDYESIPVENDRMLESSPDIKAETDKIIAGKLTDEDKAYAIYDWIVNNLYYDYDYLYDKPNNPTFRPAATAFVNKRTVCEGFSNLYSAMCRDAGIPCRVVTGLVYMGESLPDFKALFFGPDYLKLIHAWNEVYFNGTWHLVDTTWGCSNMYQNGQFYKYENHDGTYFDMSMTAFGYSHMGVEYNTMLKIDDFLVRPLNGKLYAQTYTGNSICVTLPEKIESVSYNLFSDAAGTTELILPSGFDNVEISPPFYTPYIKKITFSEGNKNIQARLFENAGNLEELILPSTMEDINEYAFSGCSSLKTVTIPSSVKTIKNSAFNYCNPETVYYDGTKEQWDKIFIDSGNTGLTNSNIIFEKAPHVHSYIATVTKEATCKDTGLITYTCSCGDSYTEIIPKTDIHTPGGWITDKEPTCMDKGSKHQVCAVCGEIINTEIIPETDIHTPGEWIIDKKPTCIDKGSKYQICAVCGEIINTEIIEKSGHTIKILNAVAPTCTSTGLSEGQQCSVCGEIIIPQTEIAVISHSDKNNDGKCDMCGIIMSEEKPQCDHMCHSTNPLIQFLWKIINFFNKLFKINQYCSCGAKHW